MSRRDGDKVEAPFVTQRSIVELRSVQNIKPGDLVVIDAATGLAWPASEMPQAMLVGRAVAETLDGVLVDTRDQAEPTPTPGVTADDRAAHRNPGPPMTLSDLGESVEEMCKRLTRRSGEWMLLAYAVQVTPRQSRWQVVLDLDPVDDFAPETSALGWRALLAQVAELLVPMFDRLLRSGRLVAMPAVIVRRSWGLP